MKKNFQIMKKRWSELLRIERTSLESFSLMTIACWAPRFTITPYLWLATFENNKSIISLLMGDLESTFYHSKYWKNLEYLWMNYFPIDWWFKTLIKMGKELLGRCFPSTCTYFSTQPTWLTSSQLRETFKQFT